MTARPETLLARLRAEPDAPDAALVGRFAAARDGDAFAALVGRHGPMVFGVCRRILRNPSDAEDAFQAVFVVLARDAGRLPAGANLGGWLHTVAVNVARNARLAAARRRAREARAARPEPDPRPSPATDAGRRELADLIDEELTRLPAAHRDAVVLCDLQGRTQDEAAGLLGRPRGTVAVHLTRGREKLRRRLESRGLTVAGLTVAGLTVAAAAVPPELSANTVAAAVTGVVPDAVRGLANGTSTGGFSMTTKLCAAAVAALAVGLGVGVTWDAGRPIVGPAAAAAPVPAAERATYAFLFGESIPKKRKPDEQPDPGIAADHIDWWVGDPDGSNLRRLDDPKTGRRLAVRPVDQTVVLKRDADGLTLLGPDGNDLYLSLKDGPLAKADITGRGERTTFAFTPDGKAVVFANAKGAVCRFAVGPNELTVTATTNVNRAEGVRVGPDGSRIAYVKTLLHPGRSTGMFAVCVANPDGTGEVELYRFMGGERAHFGFQPDGRVRVFDGKVVRAFDGKTGKSETVAGPWDEQPKFRAFGGFHPDGSSFVFDRGGPYQLSLHTFDLKSGKSKTVRDEYLESFENMIWVRVPAPAAKP